MRVAFLCTFGAILPLVARAAFYDDPACLPKRQYDYITVGAGAAGSVLANRLSASLQNVVLVIEAGPRQDSTIGLWLPAREDPWRLKVLNIDQRVLHDLEPRVKRRLRPPATCDWGPRVVMGIYVAYHQIGSPSNRNLHPRCLIRVQIEKLVPPADGHDTTGQIDPRIHGTSGPVEISIQGFRADPDSRVLKASRSTNTRLSFQHGHEFGQSSGHRPNLDVLINTQVTKVLQTGTRHGVPVLQGVQFAQSAASPVYALNATNEVILSAGAVNTPQLLMLSGIGDNAQAEQV
ncbi:aryl alcohol oxidase [Lactarius akahatsu]|uniref:Aryl alcohol oxidase n=1 Tax=Lactarius akahatsu TaxID=416441 RepID=A0AAD4L7R9_9AGAM|nr:aryl alcohol oxidase [Lactarius akahatsu]